MQIIHKLAWYKMLFNVSQKSLSFVLMCAVFSFFYKVEVVPYSNLIGVVCFLSVVMIYYFSNTILVGTMMALITKRSLNAVYRNSFSLVQWIHLLSLPIGALMAASWAIDRWLIVYGLVALVIVQRSFATVAQLQAESQRSKDLADERARLLEELKARQEDLIRASKLSSLGTFAAGIAHEFNNLLQVIDGNAALGSMTDDKDEMHHCLNLINKTSRRGMSITGGLLTFARKGTMQRMFINLDDVVTDVIAIIEPELRKHQVELVRQVATVPPTSADPGQIMQVLLNMLGNSRDAMRDTGGKITLSIYAEDADICISIADTGSGMSPELQRDLFQPFVTTKGTSGTGLGLAICYGIIEQHGGAIHVTSTLGFGTTMLIRLPIIERDEPAIRLSANDRLLLDAETSHEPARIYS